MIDLTKVLFVGYGRSVVSWYRTALPALYTGGDWVGVDDNLVRVSGMSKQPYPSWDHYDVIVWQQPRHQNHIRMMRELRAKGKIVLVEVDDYLHGVRKMCDHDFKDAKGFSKKTLLEWERTMSLSDGLICSTEFIKQRYGRFAPRSWVCKNGLDLGRYEKGRPKHSSVNIGWSGATGHVMSFEGVASVVDEMLAKHERTTFMSIGQEFAGRWHKYGNRIAMFPFCSVEVYPNAMSTFDIALAPSRDTNWYRGKSQLRFYEAAALGIPTIASAHYDEIEHGVTGFIANSVDEWRDCLEYMIVNDDARLEMGINARRWALNNVDMRVRREQWVDVITEVMEEAKAA